MIIKKLLNSLKIKIVSLNNQINQLNKKIEELNNNKINKEVKYNNGRYVGQVVNGLREGKGILYGNDGDIYDGEWSKNNAEGKGIYYYNRFPNEI